MNILLLHGLGDPRSWRRSMVDHELCLPLLDRQNRYLVHNDALPLPEYVRDIEFDAIVLCQTFLGRRRDPRMFARVLEQYDFIASSPAFKIALPQDEYDCSANLDDWLVRWNVDLVYPVCPNGWDVLFPKYQRSGRLRQGFTGYISPKAVRRWEHPKPLERRSIDVSYRSVKIPPNFGRIGQVKGTIGEAFAAAVEGRGLKLDVSTNPRDTIVGDRWHTFLEDSRFVLGANSGSSLLDADGSIAARVREYLFHHPRASFTEVEAACFPGMDGQHVFTAISPRNLECALIESAQVLTPGSYNGILNPGEHYIPIEADMSNVESVLERMADLESARQMARACKEAVLSRPELRYERHVAELLAEIAAASPSTGSADGARQVRLIDRYRSDVEQLEKRFWPRARRVEAVRGALIAMGARRIKWALHFKLGITW